MSHGVTENVVPGGLTYSGESGGLNEATSDIFGNMVEFYANSAADPGDYQVGEKININGNGTPLRYMYNPSLDGSCDSCWSTSHQEQGRALLVRRGQPLLLQPRRGHRRHLVRHLAGLRLRPGGDRHRPRQGREDLVAGAGRRTSPPTRRTSTPATRRTPPGRTACGPPTDLYGSCSTEYKTVQAAWTAVNVAGNDAPCSTGNDFSVSLSPTSGAVNPGSSVSTTVATATTSGSAQTVTLSASGLPSGATASFSPASVTSGGSSTLTIATTADTPPGTYTVTVNGAGSVTRSATYTLTVNGTGGGCTSPGQKLGQPGLRVRRHRLDASSGVIGQHGTPSRPAPARGGLAERVRHHPHRDALPVGEPAGRLHVVQLSASGCTSTRPRPPPAPRTTRCRCRCSTPAGRCWPPWPRTRT